MTAFYIGQHEIDDEAAFADYLKQTMPFIEKHGGRYLTKAGTHEMLEGLRPSLASSLSNFRASRRSRIGTCRNLIPMILMSRSTWRGPALCAGFRCFFLSSSLQISPTMTGDSFNARRANILRA